MGRAEGGSGIRGPFSGTQRGPGESPAGLRELPEDVPVGAEDLHQGILCSQDARRSRKAPCLDGRSSGAKPQTHVGVRRVADHFLPRRGIW